MMAAVAVVIVVGMMAAVVAVEVVGRVKLDGGRLLI